MSRFVRCCVQLSALLCVCSLVGCASRPALIKATVDNDTQTVTHLLQRGSDPNVRDTDENYKRTPLYWAARAGNNDLVRTLLNSGADVNRAGSAGYTPLMAALLKNGDDETVQLLIDAGADIHASANGGHSMLISAIMGNKPSAIKKLVYLGLDPEQEKEGDLNAYGVIKKYSVTFYKISPDSAATKIEGITPNALHQYREDYLKKQKEIEFEQQIVDIQKRDSGLSELLKHDKYLIAYTDALKQEKYKDAVLYANLLDRLGATMEDSFYYFWGEALLKLDQPGQAKEKLNEYIKRAGSSGKYYTQALRLIIQSEN